MALAPEPHRALGAVALGGRRGGFLAVFCLARAHTIVAHAVDGGPSGEVECYQGARIAGPPRPWKEREKCFGFFQNYNLSWV